MGKIYMEAHACLVYLGKTSGNAVVAFRLARKTAPIGPIFREYMSEGSGLETENLPPRDHPCWRTLQLDLPRRPWFRRMWVVQEVCLAKKVYVFMGGTRCNVLSLDEILDAFHVLPSVVMGDNPGAPALDKVFAARNQMACVRWLRRRVATGFSGSICDGIGGCWLSECRDPRDKIYAMLGTFPAFQASDIPVDYTMPWEQLYEHVACCLVQWGHGSDILEFAGIDTTAPGSPSWVPNWSPPMTAPQRYCSRLRSNGFYYRAGGNAKSQIRLSQIGLTFIARGMTFDTVTWISRIAQFGLDYDGWESSIRVLRKKLLTRFRMYRNGQSITEAYQSTLVAGIGLFGAERIDQNVLLEAYEAFHDQSWQTHGSDWKNYTIYETRSNEFYERSAVVANGRRLCITARGYIGLVPSNTKPQDHVVVLSGFNVPWVLRSRRGKYVLVGESYIHGIMEGEALEGPDTRLEWISIH